MNKLRRVIQQDRIWKFQIPGKDGVPISKGQFLELLKTATAFRTQVNDLIADCPFRAVYFETPAWYAGRLQEPFEMVLYRADSLAAVKPNPRPFQAYFDANPVVSFPNIGRNAQLVVPCPHGPEEIYTHLAVFCRQAPVSQRDEFWKSAALSLEAELGTEPRWFSTAGMGVHWLHLRIDQRPKYYRYAPYRKV